MKYILLTFDIEEFDTPLEYKGKIPFSEQMQVSTDGLEKILTLLDKYNCKATFYTTGTYAINNPTIIKKISEKHEIASHGFYHSAFETKDLLLSKKTLEEIINKPVFGYRMARMMPVKAKDIVDAGYTYNSSLHPTWIPGRYFHFFKKRTFFTEGKLIQLPASVSPIFRVPIFWLAFKNFNFSLIKHISNRMLQFDNYVNIYFHPWEFSALAKNPAYKLPNYVIKDCDGGLLKKLEDYIIANVEKANFTTTIEFLQNKNNPTLGY